MKNHIIRYFLNLAAVLILVTTIALPLFFAKSITKVAGVKTEAPFLLISQVDKFPSMSFSHIGNNFSIQYNKSAPKQAYLSVLIINNPTGQTKKYEIKNESHGSRVFFGENLNNQLEVVTVPPSLSVPISIYSNSNLQNVTSSFTISTR